MTGISNQAMSTFLKQQIEALRNARLAGGLPQNQNVSGVVHMPVTGFIPMGTGPGPMNYFSGMAQTGLTNLKLNSDSYLDESVWIDQNLKIIDRIGPNNQVYILQPEDQVDKIMAALNVPRQDMEVGDTWIPSLQTDSEARLVYVEQTFNDAIDGQNDLKYVCKVSSGMSIDILHAGRDLIFDPPRAIEEHRLAYSIQFELHFQRLANHRHGDCRGMAKTLFQKRVEAGEYEKPVSKDLTEQRAILDANAYYISLREQDDEIAEALKRRQAKEIQDKFDKGIWFDKVKYDKEQAAKWIQNDNSMQIKDLHKFVDDAIHKFLK